MTVAHPQSMPTETAPRTRRLRIIRRFPMIGLRERGEMGGVYDFPENRTRPNSTPGGALSLLAGL
jgi:hypothetical protein